MTKKLSIINLLLLSALVSALLYVLVVSGEGSVTLLFSLIVIYILMAIFLLKRKQRENNIDKVGIVFLLLLLIAIGLLTSALLPAFL